MLSWGFQSSKHSSITKRQIPDDHKHLFFSMQKSAAWGISTRIRRLKCDSNGDTNNVFDPELTHESVELHSVKFASLNSRCISPWKRFLGFLEIPRPPAPRMNIHTYLHLISKWSSPKVWSQHISHFVLSLNKFTHAISEQTVGYQIASGGGGNWWHFFIFLFSVFHWKCQRFDVYSPHGIWFIR